MVAVQYYWGELKRLSAILTGPPPSPGNLFAASEALCRLFLEISGLELAGPLDRQSLQLPQGKALAPVWAAHCLRDFQRTRVFLRGLSGAIQAARQRFPDTRIHVLYAGCGPFASLVVPLIPFLAEGAVEFTLLEISPESLGYLEKIIATFQLAPWIREIVLADATEYRLAAAAPVHVLVGEMMQTGLQREPQVAAMANLVPQLTPGALLVPQSVTVQVGLLHPGRNLERMLGTEAASEEVYTLLQPAFEVSAASIVASKGREAFPEMVVEIPADRDREFKQLALFTQIQVFDNERLAPWESALTQPLILTRLEPETSVQRIGLRYQTGATPGFDWRMID